MAYLSETPSSRRLATVGAVAAIHAGVAAVLLTTFAGGMLIETIAPHKSRPQWITPPADPTPVPPPSATPSAATQPDRKIVTPTPPLDLGIRNPPIDTTIDLTPLPPIDRVGGDIFVAPTLAPSPSPTAKFAPKGAAPRGNPGAWVTTNDYPTDAIRRDEQGVTGIRLTIAPDGRVRDCAVTKSSGSASLDAAACAKMSQRARFKPATDANGDAVAGTWNTAVQWVLPD